MHLLKIEKKQTLIKLPLTLKKTKKTRQLQANEVSKIDGNKRQCTSPPCERSNLTVFSRPLFAA